MPLLNITISTDDQYLVDRILRALAGVDAPPLGPVVAATPTLKADKPVASKKETLAAPEPVAAPSVQTGGPVPPAVAPAQTNTAAASPSDIPDEAALTAAANAAIAKLGPGAQGKIKEYIGANYQKDDGSPAGLRTVKVEQRAGLLADLNAFASGAKVI